MRTIVSINGCSFRLCLVEMELYAVAEQIGMKSEGERRVNVDLYTPLQLVGRSAQFQRIVEVLAQDGDLLIAGVHGSGRRKIGRASFMEIV